MGTITATRWGQLPTTPARRAAWRGAKERYAVKQNLGGKVQLSSEGSVIKGQKPQVMMSVELEVLLGARRDFRSRSGSSLLPVARYPDWLPGKWQAWNGYIGQFDHGCSPDPNGPNPCASILGRPLAAGRIGDFGAPTGRADGRLLGPWAPATNTTGPALG